MSDCCKKQPLCLSCRYYESGAITMNTHSHCEIFIGIMYELLALTLPGSSNVYCGFQVEYSFLMKHSLSTTWLRIRDTTELGGREKGMELTEDENVSHSKKTFQASDSKSLHDNSTDSSNCEDQTLQISNTSFLIMCTSLSFCWALIQH